ncbi:hypothetical protein BK735P1_00035 [Bacteroides phage BK735P1]|nr:hypothetical protein BK735P1_00035 [Bacteroides phage BK735P1]
MSNKKKLKSRDGATRITPDKSVGYFCGMYKLQAYDKANDSWGDVLGCTHLTWTEATTARKNFVALRKACKLANSASFNINVPADEVYGN